MAGDEILSRDEYNPDGPVLIKLVEEVFERTGPVLNLHVGGQVIRTSGEHPFWVESKGWTAANELQPGDLLVSHDGQKLPVEEVYDTGEWETLYNLRVSDFHTYFVGDLAVNRQSVWAHNLCVGKDYYFDVDDSDPTRVRHLLYSKKTGLAVRDSRNDILSISITWTVGTRADAKMKVDDSNWTAVQGRLAAFGIKNVAKEVEREIPSAASEFAPTLEAKGKDARRTSKAGAVKEYSDFRAKYPDFFTAPYEHDPMPVAGDNRTGKEITGSKKWPMENKATNPPTYNVHAHHIVLKKGVETRSALPGDPSQTSSPQELARKTRLILRNVGIDPYTGVENLAWTPLWSKHTSQITYPAAVYDALKDLVPSVNNHPTRDDVARNEKQGNRNKVVAALKEIAKKFFTAEFAM